MSGVRILPRQGSRPTTRLLAAVAAVVGLIVVWSLAAGAQPADEEAADGPSVALVNGGFDAGMDAWFTSYRSEATSALVVDEAGDRELDVLVSTSLGSVAQDVRIPRGSGTSYAASLRASSPTGEPVLVELALLGLDRNSVALTSARKLAVVEREEVPISVDLMPDQDIASLRFELYVHTVNRHIRLDDARLQAGSFGADPVNLGYQRPRIRYLDRVNPGRLSPGHHYRVEISVDSTTTQPWRCCAGVGSIRLGTEDGDELDGSSRLSDLYVSPVDNPGSNWLSRSRIRMREDESTLGGTFEAVIRAPDQPGAFVESFRLVSEGVTWLPGPPVELTGSVVDLPRPVVDSDADGVADLVDECPLVAGEPGLGGGADACGPEEPDLPVSVEQADKGNIGLAWVEPEALIITGYIIDVWPHDPTGEPPSGPPTRRYVTTDPNLDVASLPPGVYTVEVSAVTGEGFWIGSGKFDVAVSDNRPITEADVPDLGLCIPLPGISTIDGLPGQCPDTDTGSDPGAGSGGDGPAGDPGDSGDDQDGDPGPTDGSDPSDPSDGGTNPGDGTDPGDGGGDPDGGADPSDGGTDPGDGADPSGDDEPATPAGPDPNPTGPDQPEPGESDPPADPSEGCATLDIAFERSLLLGYAGLDLSSTTAVDLPCSHYEVHLVSIDEGHAPGYQTAQDQERWVLEGFDDQGTVIYRSPATPDLPDAVIERVYLVDEADLSGVVAFRARHLRSGTSADSVDAAVILVPVDRRIG